MSSIHYECLVKMNLFLINQVLLSAFTIDFELHITLQHVHALNTHLRKILVHFLHAVIRKCFLLSLHRKELKMYSRSKRRTSKWPSWDLRWLHITHSLCPRSAPKESFVKKQMKSWMTQVDDGS